MENGFHFFFLSFFPESKSNHFSQKNLEYWWGRATVCPPVTKSSTTPRKLWGKGGSGLLETVFNLLNCSSVRVKSSAPIFSSSCATVRAPTNGDVIPCFSIQFKETWDGVFLVSAAISFTTSKICQFLSESARCSIRAPRTPVMGSYKIIGREGRDNSFFYFYFFYYFFFFWWFQIINK